MPVVKRKRRNVLLLAFGCVVSSALLTFSSLIQVMKNESAAVLLSSNVISLDSPSVDKPRCALLFFGLPRSYELLVLPSIVQNILKPNAQCDVYAHAVIRHEEDAGRSGQGGTIDPNALFLLKNKVHSSRHVAISTDTEEEFWQRHNATLTKYKTHKDKHGKLLYFPYKLRDYTNNPKTVDNIIKQWHSIESVWNLMEMESNKLGIHYDTVGMFRNDVFFATPIYLGQNRHEAVTAGFGLYPVNDRMIYGPYHAVKIWATQRFRLFQEQISKIPRGHGMHSETFLDLVIFPAIIRNTHTPITTNANICFFRVRADLSLWINDCLRARTPRGGTLRNPKWVAQQSKLVEKLTGLPCKIIMRSIQVTQLVCQNQTPSA
jgi:hypothetical protein